VLGFPAGAKVVFFFFRRYKEEKIHFLYRESKHDLSVIQPVA
jgi:hypothetical protein